MSCSRMSKSIFFSLALQVQICGVSKSLYLIMVPRIRSILRDEVVVGLFELYPCLGAANHHKKQIIR